MAAKQHIKNGWVEEERTSLSDLETCKKLSSNYKILFEHLHVNAYSMIEYLEP